MGKNRVGKIVEGNVNHNTINQLMDIDMVVAPLIREIELLTNIIIDKRREINELRAAMNISNQLIKEWKE